MIDILVYLFENYLPDACPEPSLLARKLSAAGFEQEEISEALTWLDGLDRSEGEGVVIRFRSQSDSALRLYSEEECRRLSAECRSFLAFLEQAGTLDPELRELIVDRALALKDPQIPLAKLKVIVVTVMWKRQCEFDALVLEELLTGAEDEDEGERWLH